MTDAILAARPDPAVIPLSIYLHWPWCVRKCPYCDFNSHGAPKNLLELESVYVDALLADLEGWRPYLEGMPQREILSIFIGGGTPSLMTPEELGRLLQGIAERFPLAKDCEITMEANPGTVEAGKFARFRDAGVNRLSIGVQSFSDERLRKLGRIHSAQEVRAAIREAAEVFDNFNLDLMYALPGETMESLREELDEAVASGATHLSCYQLTIEPGTVFEKRCPDDLPDADMTAEMGDVVEARLAEASYRRYEVSGYAQEGRRCRHNLNYWTFGDYLAAGAGAHGKLTTREGVRREARAASPRVYLDAYQSGAMANVRGDDRSWIESCEVSAEDLPFEFMLNALRLLDGVPAGLFTERTGLPLSLIEPVLADLRSRGLLVPDERRLAVSRRGLDFLSDVQEAFL
ncbi:radical SAM family heme chaperone HemW [Sutterella sp.]|uniref:radical SAM family heme chaperone HemW n=1 Tax=Sutterella sp. TaxID=1981025 RepID=UPI0026DEED3E|nr:radical SAM family heme chaperone HemW [Sutterella sp.]MDO5531300.1 radical SAM family heme chaperone HemW [Sutterella sp.]